MMKTVRLILACMAILAVSTLSAQPSRSHNYSRPSSGATLPGWSSFYVAFDNHEFVQEGDDILEFSKGYTVGFKQARPMAPGTPLYLECGLELSLGMEEYSYIDDIDDYSISIDYSMLNVAVPLNVVYQYEVNDLIAISAYAGVYGRYGLAFNADQVVVEDGKRSSTAINYYDEDDTDGLKVERLIYGTQYGLDVVVARRYFVGVKFQKDMLEFFDGCTYRNLTAINIGVRF